MDKYKQCKLWASDLSLVLGLDGQAPEFPSILRQITVFFERAYTYGQQDEREAGNADDNFSMTASYYHD